MNYKKSGTRILAAGLSVVLLTGSCRAAGLQTQNEGSGETPENAQERVIVSNVDEFLSAIAPDTIVAAVAQNTSWNTKEDQLNDSKLLNIDQSGFPIIPSFPWSPIMSP